MDDHNAARRAEAKQHRGVWFDPRADKFVAEVYSLGTRHIIGMFDTATEAGAAYTNARAELPSGRATGVGFVDAFQTFLDAAGGDPERGEVLTYREQRFTFEGVAFRAQGGRRRPYYNWSTTCSTCGEPYTTLTATSPAYAKGITRNCEQHRQKGRKGWGKAPAVVVTQAGWADTADKALSALSLVADDFEIEDFLAECRRYDPTLTRAFNRFLFESDASPVVMRDSRLHPR